MTHICKPELMKDLAAAKLLDQAIRFEDTKSVKDLIHAGTPINDNHIIAAVEGDWIVKEIVMALSNGLISHLSEDEQMKLARSCPQLKPEA